MPSVPALFFQLAALASVYFRVKQHGSVRRIPIMRVVRRELKMPAELARLAVQRHERATVKIVSLSHVTIPIRAGIPHSPIH